MRTAVTGGIGSGKSYVCRLLRARGIDIYDCDAAAKRIMRSSADVRRALTELIGEHVYVGGALNKGAVASFLLRSESNARAVDSIVHPAVATDFLRSGAQWMECAILFESGFDRLVDTVVAVTAPVQTRIERIIARDGITREKAFEWIARQAPQDETARRADYIIVNDDMHDVDAQVEQLLQILATHNT